MKTKPIPECVYCGLALLRHAPGVLTLDLQHGGAERIRMSWHMRCAELDELHLAFADAVSAPDSPESDRECLAIYKLIHDRIARSGAAALRARIDVARDYRDPAFTLRGAGLLWGIRARRMAR